jgi:outer membrane protein insertion porin family
LFATGFFKDVRIEIDGSVVIVVLEERPAIAQIDFVGLKEFEKDQLIKGLKEVGSPSRAPSTGPRSTRPNRN